MRNRPLLYVCLIVIVLMSDVILRKDSRFLEEFRESPLEKYHSEGDAVCVKGFVYDIQNGDSYQALYLKDNVISSTKEKNRIYKETRILVYLEEEKKVSIGNQIQIKGTLKFFQNARNPGNFDQKLYYQKLNIHEMIWADNLMIISEKDWKIRNALYQFRQKWKEMLLEEIGEKDGNILSAMLLGEKRGMDQDTKDLYQANGISHILAISSLHLTFVGGNVYRRIRKMSGSYLAGGIGGGLFLVIYIMMIGFTVSAVRALVMFLFQVGADIAGRKYDALTAYLAAALAVLIWRPLSLYDGGFWMSFGAIGAILLVFPVWNGNDRGEHPIFESFGVSMCIQLVLLPVQLYCFYEIQPLSILMNLIVIPLMSVMLTAGMIGSFLLMTPLAVIRRSGWIVLEICKVILKFYEKSCQLALRLSGLRIVTGRPEWSAIFVYYMFLLTVIFLYYYQRLHRNKKMKKRKINRQKYLFIVIFAMGIVMMNCHPKEWRKLRVTFVDVGQGDCIYIKSPSGKSYMMDSGSSDVKKVGRYRMEPYLKYRGVKRLDYVFVSHGDADHINGIEEILERQKIGVEIGMLVLPEQFAWDDALYELAETARNQKVPVAVMKAGKKIKEKDIAITCLGPEDSGLEPGNEASMILAIQSGELDILLTGDVEGDGEDQLQSILEKEYPNTRWEILKAAHHGSKNSSKETFLEVVHPMETVISAGINNRYGHPHAETIERIKNVGSKIRSTKKQGAVEYLLDVF